MKKVLLIIFILGLIIFIGCGIGLLYEGENLFTEQSNTGKIKTNYSKTYKNTDIQSLKVNAQISEIKIKKGDHFSVESKGNLPHTEATAHVKNHRLMVEDQGKKSGINFNIGGMKYNRLTITVPTKLEELKINSEVGSIDINDIKAKSAYIKSDASDINVKKGSFDYLNIYNDASDIVTDDVSFNKAKIRNDASDIIMKELQADKPLEIDNEAGDVELSYKNNPTNTRIEANADGGDIDINNKVFKNRTVGKGDNIVTINNDAGDIIIK